VSAPADEAAAYRFTFRYTPKNKKAPAKNGGAVFCGCSPELLYFPKKGLGRVKPLTR
jgi:hypothetical protein